MARPRKIAVIDAETDPFKFGRVPQPFIWGFYDGQQYVTFNSTKEFVEYVKDQRLILYAHNGGKFDFVYLMPLVHEFTQDDIKVQIINGRIVSMFLGDCELRDSFAIMPVPLRELGAKRDIEYWKMEKENRAKYLPEIKEYLFYDCKVLYDAVQAYRIAAGNHKTIASNALAFARKIGIDPGKTNHRFDREYRVFYFGGRTECFKPGEHRDLILLDIHSAYPYAMQHEHATGSKFEWRSSLEGMTREEIQRSFIELTCHAKGCFPVKTKGAEGLHFPHAYGEYKVTGWEYLAAKDLNLISRVKIDCVRTTQEKIHFRPYVEHWYKEKLKYSPKDASGERIDKANYAISKTMMNSLYGKLAQNPARYYDYKIVKAGAEVDTKEGWTLAQEYDVYEFHRRPSLWKYEFNYGKDWVSKSIYKNVATGASITGFVRAYLLRAMHIVGVQYVVYTDTDSIICLPGGNAAGLSLTDDIGSWELEDRSAPRGFFAGKKLYAIELSKLDKAGKNKTKIASKGSKLTFSDVEKISKGGSVTWQSEAPTFNFLGAGNAKKIKRSSVDDNAKFVVRKITATAPIPAPN